MRIYDGYIKKILIDICLFVRRAVALLRIKPKCAKNAN